MANTIYGMQNYYSAFISPVKSYQTSPLTNLMYGAMANKAYSQTFASKLQSNMSSYLTSLGNNINDIKSASKPFSDKGANSSFSQKAVTASDNTSVSGSASFNADMASYTVNIAKLAKSQENTGVQLNSSAKASFSEGLNSFALTVGSSQKTVSFTIDNSDTNKTGLEKMAKAINSVKAGVTANIVSDTKTGTSFLRISGDKSGTENNFSLNDLTGNSAAASGANNISVLAQNADYSIDGKRFTSQDNTVSLNNNKVELTLSKAEGKDIRINVGTDAGAVKSDIKDLVYSYNRTIDFVQSNSGSFTGAVKLGSEFEGIIRQRRTSLENIGISLNQDGRLSIDEKKLDSALNSNISGVKDLLGGNNGIGEKLFRKSNEVLSSPMQFAKPSETTRDFNSFYNYMSSANRTSSAQNMYRGLIVDMIT